jgi:hypothetical protein
MKKLILSALMTASLAILPVAAQEPNPEKAKDHYEKAGDKVGKGAKRSGTAIKHGEVTASGKELGKGVGSGAKHAAKGTAEGARVAADRTEDVAEAGVKATKKAAKKTTRVVKDAFDGKDEKQQK